MKLQKIIIYGFAAFSLLFSACENFWNLPPLEPCLDAVTCQMAANEPTLTKLFEARIFHQTALLNDSLGMDKVLVSGGTEKPRFGQFFNVDGTALADTGQVPKEPFSVRQFAFNAVANNAASKYTVAIGGIRDSLNLMDLDAPFHLITLDAARISDRVSIYNGNNNVWTADKIEIPRAGHTATWLANTERFLLIGGNPTDGRVELYGFANTSISTSLQVNRAFHTATVFDQNQILIIGGIDFNTQAATDVVEVYNTLTNSLSLAAIGEKFTPRLGHTVNRIGNKGVVIIGGQNENRTVFHNDFLIYDLQNPARNLPNTTLPTSIAHHTATNLPNGWILIAGGQSNFNAQSDLFLFNPESEDLLQLDCSLTFARYGHSTILVESELLSEVKLLVIGGRDEGTAVLQSEMITLNLNCIEF